MEATTDTTAEIDATRIDATRLAINAAWLAQLRWVAVAGQLLTIGVVVFMLDIEAPVTPLLALVILTAVTNAGFTFWLHLQNARERAPTSPRVWHMALGGLMLLDLLVLSLMLSLTGGPTNPFAVFYFVNLALCGVVLPARWAWLLGGVAIAAFALISYQHLPVAVLRDADRLKSIAHLGRPHVVGIGALAAFAACSTVIVSFATRLTRELRQAQEARFQAEELRSRSEKLEALGTLAAGAAHELATPLGAIAVAAGELQRELNETAASPEVVDDVRLIREALARCRRILDRMSIDSGQAAGEAPEPITASDLIQEVLEELIDGPAVRVHLPSEAEQVEVMAPPTALAQAVRAIVQNALDVSPAGVELSAAVTAQELKLVVVDSGPGMPAVVLARAAEPFFTTKEPGRGMGLGLFLARSVIERIGGRINIASRPGQGTTVSVRLPVTSRT